MKKHFKLLPIALLIIVSIFTITACGSKDNTEAEKKQVKLTLTIQGRGQISYSVNDKKTDFVNENAGESTSILVDEGTTVTLEATETDNYIFVMWIKGTGGEYSRDKKTTIKVVEDTELMAVFG